MIPKVLRRIVVLTSGVLLSGCGGDPHTGGIFWSESKAQERISDRQAYLNNVQGDTSRVQSSNNQLEDAAARKRAMLNQ
jgi:hypothetical protein